MTKTAGKSSADDVLTSDALPDQAEIESLLAPVRVFAARACRVRGFLDKLAEKPPQVLLLEGGTVSERLAAAHYFTLRLNCEGASSPERTPASLPGLPGPPARAAEKIARPCFACSVCVRMVTHLHRDCFFLDGAAASIKIDDVRALRSVLGEPPREARQRLVIFREAQALVEAAANALLKAFEEPRPGTTFLLLAPQRERLLPTLVSRSLCLTLPWPKEDDAPEEDTVAWEAALTAFMAEGRGLFESTGVKGAVSASVAHNILGLCGRALARCLLARQGHGRTGQGLAALFSRLPDARLRMLDEALAEGRDSLNHGVNPVLVLEWLATRLYLLAPRTGTGKWTSP
jgi:DNA polymerase-3 subunit delta'